MQKNFVFIALEKVKGYLVDEGRGWRRHRCSDGNVEHALLKKNSVSWREECQSSSRRMGRKPFLARTELMQVSHCALVTLGKGRLKSAVLTVSLSASTHWDTALCRPARGNALLVFTRTFEFEAVRHGTLPALAIL